MESQTTPDFLISQMRVLDLPEIDFFYMSNQPTEFANLDRDLDPLLDSLEEAKALANITEAGPGIVRYYKVEAGQPDNYLMEVGIPVKPGTQPAGDAQVKTLPAYHCAGLILWGSLAHIQQAYEVLLQAFKEDGRKHTGECREVTYYFESVDSPNNLMQIFMEVEE